jgi:4-hydroxybenzoyl-CoA reductase subunit alpha
MASKAKSGKKSAKTDVGKNGVPAVESGEVLTLAEAATYLRVSEADLVQSVAEVLGLDLSRVRVVTGDSEVVPKDNGSYSSRVTFMVGNAAIDAARNLKAVFTNAAARMLDARPEDIECLGEVYRAGAQDKGATFEEVVIEEEDITQESDLSGRQLF